MDETEAETTDERSGEGVTTAEQACFEAGIKFGSLYHQFAGAPVSPEGAAEIADGIAASIENQPHCTSAVVSIKTDALADAIAAGGASYTELTGEFLNVELTIEHEGCRVVAELVMEDSYPLMSITSIDRPGETGGS